jgi:preprotein translocase subunit SecG
VALYVAAGALINLCFSVINYYFPDALAGHFYGNAVAWPISMLIVLVPILYLLEWLINRDVSRMPEKADLWVRKWRIYLTIFLAVILFGGDLITLINTYLNGEITARLICKVLVVLLVAGSVGKYYSFSLYTSHRWSKMIRRTNAWFGIIFVIVAIVLGFIAVGSPAKQRALRFDQQRVNDLQNIQWQIINYWQQKEKLPAQLNELNDTLSGYIVPTDPEMEISYQYSIKATSATSTIPKGLSFELCATFSRASQDLKGRGAFGSRGGIYPAYDMSISYPSPAGGIEDVWNHEEGRSCFVRTIDPDKYPVNKTIPADYKE